jgi:hypothetical protein
MKTSIYSRPYTVSSPFLVADKINRSIRNPSVNLSTDCLQRVQINQSHKFEATSYPPCRAAPI